MPVYCAEDVEAVIRATFPYVFNSAYPDSPASYVPKLEFNRIKGGEVFTVLGQPITPVPLVHAQFRVLGFRIDGIAYCTDVNRIPEGSVDAVEYATAAIAADLRAAREHAGLSQPELAKKLRKSASMVAGVETGRVRVGERYVRAVLKACGLPPAWKPGKR